MGKVILDKQIVDTFGKKVVRVNDLQFIKSGPHLRITHVAIGIRRLGFENLVDFFIKKINKNSKFLNRETLINWKYVHAVPDKNLQSHIKLNLSNDQLNDIHPADMADILEDLDVHGRKEIFNHLGTQTAAQTLSEIEPDFFFIFSFLVFFSALFILFPQLNLFKVLIWSQIINGILIPVILLFILNLCNDVEIMGEYTNSRKFNFDIYRI
ncbi:divalent metal cation transporter [Bacteriovoracales bacterium]|nr:divalent metal cation transporter [Bacteriovoracales bacterium]